MTISEKLSETVAQKERIANEVNSQSEKITAIKSDIYDILESDEIPKSFGAKLVDGSITEITASNLDGAWKIRKHALSNCLHLTSVTIPNTVTEIGPYAFSDCLNLTSVEIPNGVTSIGSSAFENCWSLTNIEVAEDNVYYKSIDGNLYTKSGTILIQYALGKTTPFIIPDSVTTIGDSAFYGCDSLTSIVIPNSVKHIGMYAFNNCYNLTSIEIPNSVTIISSYGLLIGSLFNKATITFLGTTPPSIQSNSFKKEWVNQIIVPKGYGEVYKSATNFSNFADYIVEATE